MTTSSIRNQIRRILPQLVNIRHYIHQHAEDGYNEIATAAMIERELSSYGLAVSRVGKTGVVGLLAVGGGKGKTVALRSDIDALPMIEQTRLPYASVGSCMHACGHDGHTAALLGAARVLAGMRDQLRGKVKFIFQPAEENGGGGLAMCKAGVLEKPAVDCIFALHGWPDHPLGSIALSNGAMMASWDRLELTVIGRGGHGARPEETIDPIVIAGRIVDALQTIVSRNLSASDQAVISIGTIQGGSIANVIPDRVEMTGTIRTLDEGVRRTVLAAIKRICTQTAAAMGGRCIVKTIQGYPATINTPNMAELVREIGREVLGASNVHDLEKCTMVAEDFSYYLQRVPGCYFRLGLADASHRAGLHNSAFDFNDKALPLAVELMTTIALRATAQKAK